MTSGKSRNRPLRAIIAFVLALGAAVADHVVGIPLKVTSPGSAVTALAGSIEGTVIGFTIT